MTLDILMIGWELPPHISGGLGVACFGLSRALSATAGMRLTFAMPKPLRDEQAPFMDLVPLPPAADQAPAGNAYGGNMISAVFAYGARIDAMALARRPHIVHGHDWLSIPALLQARRAFGVPALLHVHSTEYERASSCPDPAIVEIERFGFSMVDHIAAVSAATRRVLIERYGVAADKVTTVHNGIARGTDTAPGMARKYVTFVGRMTAQKGAVDFLAAAVSCLRRNPGLRFVMAGDGDQLAELKRRAVAYGVADKVCFPGFLDQEEVVSLLDQSVVFVMPSLYEPFGLVALEAVQRAVPVIISENSGVAEILAHAIKVPPADAGALAHWIGRLTDDAQLRASLVQGAARDLDTMTWERAAAAVGTLYAALRAGDIAGARDAATVAAMVPPG